MSKEKDQEQNQAQKEAETKKEYIITYKSAEHHEVLGWIEASSMKQAKKKAKKFLLGEAEHYGVEEAEIAEWRNGDTVSFDLADLD